MVGDALSDIAEVMLPEGGLIVAALYHAYFDESGSHDGSPFMTIGGYVFEADQARKFSRDWGKDLKRFGLSYAHMTDCALGFGEYRDLTLEQRVESEKRLIEHIKRRSMFGFAATVGVEPYKEIIGDFPGVPSIYSSLLMITMCKVRDHLHDIKFDGRVAYFFESGHESSSEAHNYMNVIPSLGRHAVDHHFYAGHAFVDKRDAAPLQAADMLAWQHRHHAARWHDGHKKARKDFVALTRPVDMQSYITKDHLRGLRTLFEVSAANGGNLPLFALNERAKNSLRHLFPPGSF